MGKAKVGEGNNPVELVHGERKTMQEMWAVCMGEMSSRLCVLMEKRPCRLVGNDVFGGLSCWCVQEKTKGACPWQFGVCEGESQGVMLVCCVGLVQPVRMVSVGPAWWV